MVYPPRSNAGEGALPRLLLTGALRDDASAHGEYGRADAEVTSVEPVSSPMITTLDMELGDKQSSSAVGASGDQSSAAISSASSSSYWDLCTGPLAKVTAAVCFAWFMVTFAYFGLNQVRRARPSVRPFPRARLFWFDHTCRVRLREL